MAAEYDKITDLRFLHKFTGGDKVKMLRYINMFTRFAPVHIGKMEKCANEKNWSGLSISISLLSGQMVYMGIRRLENLDGIVETLKRKKPSPDKIKECILGLKNNLNIAIEELKDEYPSIS